MAKTINVKAEVNIPEIPNFLRYSDGVISIADVTDECLQEIGKAWTNNLIVRARQIREAREGN